MRNGWFIFWCIICTILMIGALISMPILYSFGLVSYVPISLIVFYLSTIVMMLLMLDTSNNYNKQIKENKKMNYENEINEIKENINKLNKRIDLIDTLAYNSNILNRYDNGGKRFKVGDRVQFKTWEEMKKEKGYSNDTKTMVMDFPVVFTREMDYLCGTYATIKQINGKGVELCDFTANGDTLWCYSLDMLKHAENEPKWVFTEDEKTILRNVDKDYKYITRNIYGDLELYAEKPEKTSATWFNECDNAFFDIYNHIFKCLQWTDDEPCEFRKYI